MCIPGIDPLTIGLTLASAAATGVGAKRNADAQNAVIDTQNRENQKAAEMRDMARQEEEQRQLTFEQQQQQAVSEALTRANPVAHLTEARAAASNPETPIIAAPAQYNQPTVAGQAENANINAATAGYEKESSDRLAGIVQAMAKLSAMDTSMSDSGLAINQTGSDIATIGGNRRGSMNSSRLGMSIPAAEVRQGDDFLGDLLVLGGAGAAGLAGKRAGAANLTIGDILAKKSKAPNVQAALLNAGGTY